MGLAKQIADKYGVEILERPNSELVASKNFTSFLAACKEEGAVIIGIEGFRLEGKTIIPEMGAIADFSDLRSSEASASEATRFFLEVNDDSLFYNFTIYH